MSAKINYRVLNKAELEGLSKEFIEFLVLNGITAEDWENIKSEFPERAEEIIAYFSEAVFEQIFRKVQFMERITEREILCYQCLAVRIVVVGVRLADHVDKNFLKDDIKSLLKDLSDGDLIIFHGKEKYEGKREHHLYKLSLNNFSISEGEYFKAISSGL